MVDKKLRLIVNFVIVYSMILKLVAVCPSQGARGRFWKSKQKEVPGPDISNAIL